MAMSNDKLIGWVSGIAFFVVWAFAGAGRFLDFKFWWPCVLAVIVLYFPTVALISIFRRPGRSAVGRVSDPPPRSG